MMVLTLHNLAERYKCLPSEALARANTLDLYVLDVSTKWHNHQQDKSEGKVQEVPQISQEEMMEMIKRTREQK